MLSVSVVVPTYNERENIEPLAKGIRRALAGRKFEILIVDDASPDGTGELVRSLSKEIPQLRLVPKERRKGIGAALRLGYDRARLEVLLSLDADLSFDPADIPRLLQPIEDGLDMVVGTRHAPGGSYQTPRWRIRLKYWVSRWGNAVVRRLVGLPISDYSGSFRALRRSVWERIETSDDTNCLLLEMILESARAGCRICEVPVVFRDRVRGESKLNLWVELPGYALRLLRHAFRFRLRT